MRRIHDVFLSYNSTDKPSVEKIARIIERDGFRTWFDEWKLVPGEPWQEALENGLDSSKTCAVFIGKNGLGPWQNEETRSAIEDRVRDAKFRVIPVLLPGAKKSDIENLPRFLKRLTWADFRNGVDDKQAQLDLIDGIRGIHRKPPPHRKTAKLKTKNSSVLANSAVLVSAPPASASRSDFQSQVSKSADALEEHLANLAGLKSDDFAIHPIHYFSIKLGDTVLEIRRGVLDVAKPDDPKIYAIAEQWGMTYRLLESFNYYLSQGAISKNHSAQVVNEGNRLVRSLLVLSKSLGEIRA